MRNLLWRLWMRLTGGCPCGCSAEYRRYLEAERQIGEM